MTQLCGPVPAVEFGSNRFAARQASPILHRNSSASNARRGEKEGRAVDLVFSALRRRADIDCRTASSADDLFAAFGLVYEEYVRSGLMKPNACQMRITPYHLLPSTEVLVALDREDVSCTMSVVRDGEMGLPMESVYHEEIACLRLQGLQLAEVSCLADTHKAGSKSESALFQLMPLVAQLAYYRGVDQLVIAVHPRHARFYHRFLGFEVIAEERTYGQVCGKPAVALAMDLKRLAVNHPRVYEWLFGESFSRSALDYNPIHEAVLEEMRMVVEACFAGISGEQRQLAISL